MSSATDENGPDPDLVAALWHKVDEYNAKRASLAECECELLLLLTKLEALNTSVLEMLKICNEPLLLSVVLSNGRYSPIHSADKRSLAEIYDRVITIAREVKRDSREG